MVEKHDFAAGISIQILEEGRALFGNVGQEPVFVLRTASSIKAFSAICSHLGGPLQDGLLDGMQVVCPWHHACFDLGTGKAMTAPAFNSLERYDVEVSEGKVVVKRRRTVNDKVSSVPSGRYGNEKAIAIVGGGAAGFAAAHTLRAKGWKGNITMYTADAHPPYDRTLLTKDYLDGHFGDDRLEIAKDSVQNLAVDLELGVSVESVDVGNGTLALRDGRTESFQKLLLATGSTPRNLSVPGGEQVNVLKLRTLADCRRLLSATSRARRVVVIGASFIGLEAAASLRSRGLSVEVVAPQEHPLENLLGRALSDLIVGTLKGRGVKFRLGRKPECIDGRNLILDNGEALQADVILLGIGVAPSTGLARSAGLRVENGVVVDAQLRTSQPDIYAAGDIANWPDRTTGERIRIEHWVVAQRQGQVAAANMLGLSQEFTEVPFFWSKFFDLSFRYVGHAEDWDEVRIEGDLCKRDAVLRYSKAGQDLAVATVGRDRDALLAERAFQARVRPGKMR